MGTSADKTLMNIRSLSNPQIPTKVDTANDITKAAQESVKTRDATERDADGRQPYGQKKRAVTEEELKKILKAIREHDGVVNNELVVTFEEFSDGRPSVITITSAEGELIRRVTEDNFADLLSFINEPQPRLLNKSA